MRGGVAKDALNQELPAGLLTLAIDVNIDSTTPIRAAG
jgi:hypothetical protein